MGKKSKKGKPNVAPPPDSAKQHSESTEISMTNESSERPHEETSSVSQIEEDVTSSDTLRRNTEKSDTHTEKSKLPEHNEYDVAYWKNTCSAIKSDLKTMTKKHEDEKTEKEKLFQQNENLKLQVSSLEKQLEAAKVLLEKLEKETTHHRKSDEKRKGQSVNVGPPVADGSVQPERKPSDENTSEKSGQWGDQEDNAKESWDDPSSSGGHDVEMTEPPGKDESGAWGDSSPRGEHNNWADNNHLEQTHQNQQSGSTAWYQDTDAASSTQPSDYPTGTATTGWQKGRNDMDHNHNGWSQQKPKYKNEDGHRGPRTYYSGQPNRHGNNYREREGRMDNRGQPNRFGPNYGERGGRMDNRGDRGQNWNRDVDYHNRQDNFVRGRGRERGMENRDNGFRGRGRDMENRGDRGQNYNRDRMTTTDEPPVLWEVSGDLFSAPPEYSLAHCVAEDMRMGSGIAVSFRQKFKSVDELLDQRKRQGHVAVLEHEGRYIYYLVTKRESTGKPTMETLERSLEDMRAHVVEHQVKNIAMPRIGCGLDRLEWRSVRPLIERIFKGTGAQITVYNYNEDPAESSKAKLTSYIRLKNAQYPVAQIAQMTAILCLCAADGSVDSTLGSLDNKFRIMAEYQKMDRKLGSICEISKPQYAIFLLIVKHKRDDQISFKALGECMQQATKSIHKQEYVYVAIEAFDDENDPFLFDKVITVIKNRLDTKYEKELWLCWPKTVSVRQK